MSGVRGRAHPFQLGLMRFARPTDCPFLCTPMFHKYKSGLLCPSSLSDLSSKTESSVHPCDYFLGF